ncbi:MAG: hypothetical protein EOO65_05940, partial [Methanosarcinales archaeon]
GMPAPSVLGGGSDLNILGGTLGGFGGPATTLPTPAEEDRQVAAVSDSVKGEFKSALYRFTTVLSHTIQQVSGDVRLDIPDVVIDDAVAASQDEGVKAMLVEAVEEWTRVIAQVLGVVTDRDKGTRPLQEIEFWRTRNATLSTIYEQLNQTVVKNMLTTLEIAREPALDTFKVCDATLPSVRTAHGWQRARARDRCARAVSCRRTTPSCRRRTLKRATT